MNTLNNVDKPKVLIVESDAEKSAELKNIISSHYEVVETVPENAVSLISNKENGITTAILYIKHAALIVRELRSFIPTAKFPILISTDIENSELENELLDLEVIDFLKKPYDKRRVLNRIKTTIKLAEANKAIDELERDELTGLLTR